MAKFDNISAVILAGGRGRRMGTPDKALLELNGESFLRRITAQLDGMFREVFLSVDDSARFPECGLTRVGDRFPDSGALGGILSSLCACGTGALFVVACDMPLFERALAEYICSFDSAEFDALLTVTRDGRLHPICGIYRKSAVPVLERRVSERKMYMLGALAELNVKQIQLSQSPYPDYMLTNINTAAELETLRQSLIRD